MGGQEIMEISAPADVVVNLCNGGVLQFRDNFEEKDNPGVNGLLNDLDSYLEDIDNRLIISRMVSESVTKGMICAVEQEAAEKISEKEKELDKLEEMLHLCKIEANKKESVRHSLSSHQSKGEKYEHFRSYSDALIDPDKLEEHLGNLRDAAKKLFKELKIEIEKVKGSCSMRRISSNSELLGLGGILHKKVPDKWVDMDTMLNSLRTSLDSVCDQAGKIVYLSKSVLCDWRQDREFKAEIEEMVIKNCFRGLQEQFEKSLWGKNAGWCGNESAKWLEKVKEISNLRQELDTISKSLAVPERGVTSHGLLEHRKVSGNHLSSTTSLWEENGKLNDLIPRLGNLDLAQLNHLSKEELASYFKAEMIKMNRNHELKVREMTEEYFSLKREFLRERASLPAKKYQELDLLRKKIPEVVLKLDHILVENEKVPAVNNNMETFDNMKNRLETLLSENRQLRNLLTDKKKEIECLSSQVSDAAEEMSRQALAEASLLETIANIKSVLEDANIEASISEDLHNFLLKDLVGQMKCVGQEANMEIDIYHGLCEIILREAAEIADSDVESAIMQGLSEVIYKEALKEAKDELTESNLKLIHEKEVLSSLQMEKLEKERALRLNVAEKEELEQKLLLLTVEVEMALRLNVAEKEELEQKLLLLTAEVEEKDNLLQQASNALAEQREKFDLTSQELDSLRNQTSEQQVLINQSKEEVQVLKGNLVEASKKIKRYEGNTRRFMEAVEEKGKKLLVLVQEKQNALSLMEESERQYKKQMGSNISLIQELLRATNDFESRTVDDIRRKNLRLKNLSCQVSSLSEKANNLRRTGLSYKQRLERRSSDLQKAEAEVDLLGDEVDTLLSLIEKIYISLDHYSPVLCHYPGVVEILKLMRRELSGYHPVKPV